MLLQIAQGATIKYKTYLSFGFLDLWQHGTEWLYHLQEFDWKQEDTSIIVSCDSSWSSVGRGSEVGGRNTDLNLLPLNVNHTDVCPIRDFVLLCF